MTEKLKLEEILRLAKQVPLENWEYHPKENFRNYNEAGERTCHATMQVYNTCFDVEDFSLKLGIARTNVECTLAPPTYSGDEPIGNESVYFYTILAGSPSINDSEGNLGIYNSQAGEIKKLFSRIENYRKEQEKQKSGNKEHEEKVGKVVEGLRKKLGGSGK